MNVLKLEDVREDLINYLKSRSLLPVIGSGFTVNEKALNGIVPSGETFKNHMLNELKTSKKLSNEDINHISNLSFSEICSFYENDDFISKERRIAYYKNNFSAVVLPENKKGILEIDWPYIYSLNIDDAIENALNLRRVIVSNRDVYDNAFKEKCVIKLHGDVTELITYPNSDCLIFSKSQYALSIRKNYSLLTKLENDFKNQNIIYIGCSLTDEIDLLSISSVPFSNDGIHKIRRFYFCLEEPKVIEKQKLKQFNITDIILINDYNDIYTELNKIWVEAKKISSDELGLYCNIPVLKLKQSDDNEKYFYYGKLLHNKKENKINIPFYFIRRTIIHEIKKELMNNNLILLEGGALSGKSYLLTEIYEEEKSQLVFLFDSSTKIRQSSFEKLIKKENILILFDIGSLNREQFDYILNAISVLNKKNTKIIINLSFDRSDLLGLVKLKLINKEIDETYIKKIRIPNFFDSNELFYLNKLLPQINIPVFFEKRSIVDNVIITHKEMSKGKYSKKEIKISSYKDLVVFILLMTKEKIYSYDQVKFSIEKECYLINTRLPEVMEEIETVLIEKDSEELSNYKYILNAKIWLQNELTNFAKNKENYTIIQDAYLYIVERIMNEKGDNLLNSRENYREYILFDSINNIFVNRHKENLPLILSIYEKLNTKLSNDYQFLHQFSKGLFMISLNENDPAKKEKCLDDARGKIIIAESLVNKVIENKTLKKEDIYRNIITLDHMRFTKSLILCEIAKVNKYKDPDLVLEVIEILYNILIVTSTSDTFMQGSERSKIVNELLINAKGFDLQRDVKKKISELLTYMMSYK